MKKFFILLILLGSVMYSYCNEKPDIIKITLQTHADNNIMVNIYEGSLDHGLISFLYTKIANAKKIMPIFVPKALLHEGTYNVYFLSNGKQIRHFQVTNKTTIKDVTNNYYLKADALYYIYEIMALKYLDIF